MSGIPVSELSPEVRRILGVSTRSTISIFEAKRLLENDLPWARDKALRKLENITGRNVSRQRQTIVDTYDAAESALWSLVYPPHIGGHGESEQPTGHGFDPETGTYACRSCPERISRSELFHRAALCEECWRRATGGQ